MGDRRRKVSTELYSQKEKIHWRNTGFPFRLGAACRSLPANIARYRVHEKEKERRSRRLSRPSLSAVLPFRELIFHSFSLSFGHSFSPFSLSPFLTQNFPLSWFSLSCPTTPYRGPVVTFFPALAIRYPHCVLQHEAESTGGADTDSFAGGVSMPARCR